MRIETASSKVELHSLFYATLIDVVSVFLDFSASMHCMRTLTINGELYSAECKDKFDEYEASLGYNSTLKDFCE